MLSDWIFFYVSFLQGYFTVLIRSKKSEIISSEGVYNGVCYSTILLGSINCKGEMQHLARLLQNRQGTHNVGNTAWG